MAGLLHAAVNGYLNPFSAKPEFSAHPQLAGYRLLSGAGDISAFNPLTTGFSRDSRDPVYPPEALCGILHPEAAWSGSRVPVASFSDYRCPFCRILAKRLYDLEEKGTISLTIHEWPILGRPSVMMARAALAAGRQDAFKAVHLRFMRSGFLPTEAYLAALADEYGLDGEKLSRDMENEAVTAELRQSDRLARTFGLPGTPAIVVGRTIVAGEISPADLAALIAAERDEGRPAECR